MLNRNILCIYKCNNNNQQYRMKYEIKRYPAAPNLWCVWDNESNMAVYAHVYRGFCRVWVEEHEEAHHG